MAAAAAAAGIIPMRLPACLSRCACPFRTTLRRGDSIIARHHLICGGGGGGARWIDAKHSAVMAMPSYDLWHTYPTWTTIRVLWTVIRVLDGSACCGLLRCSVPPPLLSPLPANASAAIAGNTSTSPFPSPPMPSPPLPLPPMPAAADAGQSIAGFDFLGSFLYLLGTSMGLGLAAGGVIAALMHRFKRHGPHHVSGQADSVCACVRVRARMAPACLHVADASTARRSQQHTGHWATYAT